MALSGLATKITRNSSAPRGRITSLANKETTESMDSKDLIGLLEVTVSISSLVQLETISSGLAMATRTRMTMLITQSTKMKKTSAIHFKGQSLSAMETSLLEALEMMRFVVTQTMVSSKFFLVERVTTLSEAMPAMTNSMEALETIESSVTKEMITLSVDQAKITFVLATRTIQYSAMKAMMTSAVKTEMTTSTEVKVMMRSKVVMTTITSGLAQEMTMLEAVLTVM